ncbi:MAG: hypothetical protein DRI65_13970 [Chloroflexota bacterium]|nr:MAG: hypothetical protein DRI65_13970 [Chloroflexota bacterium]
MANQELIFHQKMLEVYEKARDQDYFATYFKGMLDQYGGLETAKRLLAKSQPQTGLFRLWELKMLDSSMEALVIQERFSELFTEDEIQEAKNRLEELNYFKDY